MALCNPIPIKLHFHCLLLIFSATVQAASVQEIKDLQESGFSEEQILELVIKEKNYEVSDLIELKKMGFSPNFIINLRNKDLANAVNLLQRNSKEETSSFKDQIEESERKLSDLEKCLTSLTRTFEIIQRKTYQSTGLWSDRGSLYKTNGYDQSLEAPARDSSRFLGLLSSAISDVSDDLGVSENDCFSLIDTWVDMKRSAMEVDAISVAARSDAYKRSDNRPSSRISAELNAERSEFRNYSTAFEAKKGSLISAINKAIAAEKQNLEKLLIKNKDGSYEEKIEGITYKGTWKASMNHGKRISFYDNGVKEGEDNWIEGVKIGLEQRWYENGDIKYEISRDNSGLKNGLETHYYQGGAIKSQVIWQLGRKNGDQKSFEENGQLISSFLYEKDDLLEIKNYQSNGSIKIILTTDSETRRKTLIKFDENNNSVSSFQFLNEVEIKKPNVPKRSDRFTEIDGSFREISELSNSQLESSKKKDLRFTFKVLSDVDSSSAADSDNNITYVIDGNVKYRDKELQMTYEGNFDAGIPLGLHKLTFDSGDNYNFSFEKNGFGLLAENKSGDNVSTLGGYLSNAASRNHTGFAGALEVKTPNGHRRHLYNDKPIETDIYAKGGGRVSRSCYGGTDYGQVGSRVYYNNDGKEVCLINMQEDLLDGICRISTNTGKLLISSSYENDLRIGRTFIYHKNGMKAAMINYIKVPNPEPMELFNPFVSRVDGKVLAWYDDGKNYNPQKGFFSTTIELYSSKDSLWRKGNLKKGHPNGIHYEYTEDGSVLREKEFNKNNQFHNFGIFELNFDKDKKFEQDRTFAGYQIHSNQDLIKESLEDLNLFKPIFDLDTYIDPLSSASSMFSEVNLKLDSKKNLFTDFIPSNLDESIPSEVYCDFKVKVGLTLDNAYDKGVIVKSINDQLPIAKSGLKVGDIITEINEIPISNILEFVKLVRYIEPQDMVNLSVFRDTAFYNFKFSCDNRTIRQ